MKIEYKALLVFIMFGSISSCFSQTNSKSELIGQWEYSGDAKDRNIECTDILVIKEGGQYEILNDCYTKDTKTSIIESGNWILEADGHVLEVNNRDISKGGGYSIWNKQNVQKFKIVKSDKEVIELSYFSNEKNTEIVETWKKIK